MFVVMLVLFSNAVLRRIVNRWCMNDFSNIKADKTPLAYIHVMLVFPYRQA